MSNQNGQLILKTLQNLDEPSSAAEISKLIADTVGVGVNDVKGSVKETLDGGVRYGYVQRINKKYFMAPLELNEIVDDSKDVDINKEDTAKKLEKSFARRLRSKARRTRSRRRRLGVRRRRR